MDSKLKEKWVKALRSGRYHQVKGDLKADADPYQGGEVGYCCLGVLCTISRKGKWAPSGGSYIFETKDGNFEGDLLIYDAVRPVKNEKDRYVDELSVKMFGVNKKANSILVRMNDNGSNFKEIADWIEDNL